MLDAEDSTRSGRRDQREWASSCWREPRNGTVSSSQFAKDCSAARQGPQKDLAILSTPGG